MKYVVAIGTESHLQPSQKFMRVSLRKKQFLAVNYFRKTAPVIDFRPGSKYSSEVISPNLK